MHNLNPGQTVTITGHDTNGTITAVGEPFPAKSRMAFRWITVRLNHVDGRRCIVVTDDKVRPL